MDLASLFGYAGTITGTFFMVPQVLKSFKTRSVRDVSWGMLLFLALNCFFWFFHGLFLGSTPLMLANAATFAVVVLQITLKVRYRNNP